MPSEVQAQAAVAQSMGKQLSVTGGKKHTHTTTRLVVISKNKVIIVILVLVFILVVVTIEPYYARPAMTRSTSQLFSSK